MEVYINVPGPTPPPEPEREPERRGVSVQMPITAAKEAVTVMRLVEREAAAQGKEVIPAGAQSKTLCLLPNHQEKTASFYVSAEKNAWFCQGCYRGGDVVELARLLWDFPDGGRGAAMAAAELLMTFGHEIPQRPPSWFSRQARQKPVRDEMRRLAVRILRRRLYAILEPMVLAVEDDDLRADVSREVWDALGRQAEDLYSRRIGTGR